MTCNLDTENEIAVGKENADRRTMQVGMREVESGEGARETIQAYQQRH